MSAAEPAIPETPENSDSVLPAITWKPWSIKLIETDYIDEFHAIPTEDKQPHILSQNCACNPFDLGERLAQSGDWYPYYRHNSYDLREIDEWFYYNIQHPELGLSDKDMV